MIYLLYATKVNVGGWTTFTKHLHDSLEFSDVPVEIVKLGNRDETFTRPFGTEGHLYNNVTLETLLDQLKHGDQCIVTAVGKHFVEEVAQLSRRGAKVVVHDPAEPAFRMDIKNPWVIRRSMLKYADDATFIRHPYVRTEPGAPYAVKRKRIIAPSRVDFDKNTTMILDANRLGANIEILGFENRLYSKFKILPFYPEYVQTGGYRRDKSIPTFDLLQNALAMVDLTDIKGDGGGTQYTFLEAWDAGAIPIIGEWWRRKGDDMTDNNALFIDNAKQLASTIKTLRARSFEGVPMRQSGYNALKRHAPKVIVPQVMEWLNV